jgi:hypothetical protein
MSRGAKPQAAVSPTRKFCSCTFQETATKQAARPKRSDDGDLAIAAVAMGIGGIVSARRVAVTVLGLIAYAVLVN